jgi:hypothetical protein
MEMLRCAREKWTPGRSVPFYVDQHRCAGMQFAVDYVALHHKNGVAPGTLRCPVQEGATDMMKIAFEIRKLARSLAVLSAILLPVLHTGSAHAQNPRSYVSHNGNDGNNCSTAATACLTFQGALGKTTNGGEITCVDFGLFGNMNVTLSVTVDCRATGGMAGVGCNSAILINAQGMVVTLRGLTVTASTNCVQQGIAINTATAVFIEDCVVQNNNQFGILDQRTSGLTRLVIKNTIIRNNGSAGIVLQAARVNSVVLENVQSVFNTFGIAVATGSNVVISRSVMSENASAGIEADPGALVVVDNTEISHNVNYGVIAFGTVTLANSDISFNNSSILGTAMSYGNNRLFGNGGGTAPTPIGQQ